VVHTGERLRFEAGRAEEARREAERAVKVALDRLNESDAALAGVADQVIRYAEDTYTDAVGRSRAYLRWMQRHSLSR
jgi:hypothetical protein